jgi:hypothetical protein
VEPSITTSTAQAIVQTKTAPRVTEASIKGKIGSVDYVRHDKLTLAIVTMKNGFKVVGKAAPASRENFDAQVGERYAYDDAFEKLWQLEGYLLREQLSTKEQA